jgi:2-polyprenyl-3-methyl-5-hydroxy-6-metoxy-1,4-benzoquinol methylase
MTMNLSCPLCGSGQYDIVYEKLAYFPDADIVKCRQCGHLYTLIIKEVDTRDLYSDAVYKVVENRDSIYDRILNREYRGVIRQINSFNREKGKLLDFGSGKGKFGMLAKEDGWEVRCVETSPERAAYAKEVYGLEVSTVFYEGGAIFPFRFDVLTLFHVLEHLPGPEVLLRELIAANVEKGGLVVFEVPNIKSLQSRIAKDKWIHLDVPRHIHHFSPERLEQFLRQLGLKPLKTTYFSFHLGVLGMVDTLLKLFGYRNNIIYELKNKKNKRLLLKVALLLPIAILLESVASGLRRGAVIRMYLTG